MRVGGAGFRADEVCQVRSPAAFGENRPAQDLGWREMSHPLGVERAVGRLRTRADEGRSHAGVPAISDSWGVSYGKSSAHSRASIPFGPHQTSGSMSWVSSDCEQQVFGVMGREWRFALGIR